MKEKQANSMGELLMRYADDPWMATTIESGYGRKTVQLEDGGSIDFDPDGLKAVVNGEKLTYNEYIVAQIRSIGHTHSGFQQCFYNIPLEFKGQIEKISKTGRICFRRIYILGMFPDGECFENKEDHVWMDPRGFESFHVGDCVSFSAEPYRYLKSRDGKRIDYAIKNPTSVKKITQYDLPTYNELLIQEINHLLCEVCYLNESCSHLLCPLERQNRAVKQEMLRLVKQGEETD